MVEKRFEEINCELSQIVSEPTRIVNSASTLIDLAFTSTHRMVQLCETIPPLANSDHLGIHLILSIKLHKKNIQKPQTRKVWQYNLANFDQAVELLESIEWENLLSNTDSSLYWSTWKHYFLQVMDISIPHITVHTKKFGSIPWINNEIKKAMTKRNTLYRRLKRSNANLATDRMRYTAMRNKVVTLLRESKQRFFDELNNADTKQFWRTMRILNRKSSVPSLQDENNATIESNTGKANALNSFFHRCFNYTFPSLIEFPDALEMNLPPNECPKQLLSTEESVYDLLITLDTSKSTGCDSVSASMLKQTACSTALSLSKLINLSLSTGQVPYEWKLARITPIPKPGKDKN